jgi:hypothetical protein
MQNYTYNDGGRAMAGYKGTTGDCVCRAIAIAAEMPYQYVYELINQYGKQERKSKGRKLKSTAASGVYKQTIHRIVTSLGFKWVPTMFSGQGCKVHLKADELPKGRLIVNVSKHTVAVIDGVINDIYDPTREGTRCVYGYYYKPQN